MRSNVKEHTTTKEAGQETTIEYFEAVRITALLMKSKE
jgi:hypothetical protein